MAQPINRHYPGTPGTPLYVGIAPPGVGTLLTTLTLQNTSAAVQAAGFVSPMFGLPLKQGDMPAGQYPQFKLTGGTNCPASIWGVSSWPDGSMKFCAAMVRVPASVAGSGTLALQVYSGGTAPAPSARTTADLAAADIRVELTGVTNLAGLWTASLNTAIADADDIVVIGDGPAGKVWRIGGPCKQAGAAHGQLHAWHYVAALTNSVGGLLGLRYLGRIAQPWADVTTPAVAKRECTASLKSGGTELRSLQGTQAGETLSSTITIPHYTDFYTCAADGRWDFMQGGGSASADCAVRVVQEKVYLLKSHLLPAYDLTVTPTSSPSVDYAAQCKGLSQERAMNSGGPRIEIGILPGWIVRHILTQSAVDERAVRVSGLASGGWRNCIHQSTTKEVVACVDIQASYTGLGAAQPTWRYFSSGLAVGVNPIPTTHLWDYDYEPSHRPSSTYYPYLITGEPQYLDMLAEQAAGLILGTAPGGNVWKVGAPISGGTTISGSWSGERNPIINGTTYKGAGIFFRGDLYRIQAWMSRDIAQAAAIYPDVCPSGTEKRKYLRDVVASSFAALNAYNNALPATWRDSGLASFLGNGATDAEYESPWAFGYLSKSVCHQSMILPDVADIAVYRQHIAKFYSSIHAIADVACVAAYRMSQWKGDNTRVESAADLVFSLSSESLTASTADSKFTITGVTPANGDVFAFSTQRHPDKPYAEATDNTRFYAVNCAGSNFQLAATPGGSPITVTSNVTITSFMCRLQNASPKSGYDNDGSNLAYIAEIYAAIRLHEACGDSGVNAVRLAMDSKWAATGTTFNSMPNNAMAAAYPG